MGHVIMLTKISYFHGPHHLPTKIFDRSEFLNFLKFLRGRKSPPMEIRGPLKPYHLVYSLISYSPPLNRQACGGSSRARQRQCGLTPWQRGGRARRWNGLLRRRRFLRSPCEGLSGMANLVIA